MQKNILSRPTLAMLALLGALGVTPAQACSGTEPYIATVCTTAATFCPRGYAEASGQLLSIAQYTALFSLVGTTYGGNGQTTFALPDLRGRTPVGRGQGPGLSDITQGEAAGTETVSLLATQMPPHTHTATVSIRASTANGGTDNPSGAVPAKLPRSNVYTTAAPDTTMASNTVTIGTAGNGQPVPIRNPFLGLRYCIALEGIYPSQP